MLTRIFGLQVKVLWWPPPSSAHNAHNTHQTTQNANPQPATRNPQSAGATGSCGLAQQYLLQTNHLPACIDPPRNNPRRASLAPNNTTISSTPPITSRRVRRSLCGPQRAVPASFATRAKDFLLIPAAGPLSFHLGEAVWFRHCFDWGQ